MVSVPLTDGTFTDIMDKKEMEKAIIIKSKKANSSNHFRHPFITILITKSSVTWV
jgi:hypothetical protein